jgi:hypothetical protein
MMGRLAADPFFFQAGASWWTAVNGAVAVRTSSGTAVGGGRAPGTCSPATERTWPTRSGSVASAASVEVSGAASFRVFDAVTLVVGSRARSARPLRLAAG